MAFDKAKFLSALKQMKESFVEEQKFKDAKLKDGVTIIRYDAEKLDVGVPVMVLTESGAIAIPDGDYELEDGTKFTVANGTVSAATPGADPNAEPPADAPAATAQAQSTPAPMNEAQAKAIVESIIKETRFAEQITELKAQIAELKTEKEKFATQKADSEKELTDLKAEVAKNKETLTQLFSLIEKIGDIPSASPTEGNKNTKKKTVKELQAEFRNTLK